MRATRARKIDPAPDKLLMRPAAACIALDVSATTLRGMMDRGEIDSVKIGRSRRIVVASLHKLAGSSGVSMQAQTRPGMVDIAEAGA